MTDFDDFMREIGTTKEEMSNAMLSNPVESLPDFLYLGPSKIAGEGVFPNVSLGEGRTIGTVWNNGWTQAGLKINHSRTPNCKLNRTSIIVAQQIQPNEEITLNYRDVRSELL